MIQTLLNNFSMQYLFNEREIQTNFCHLEELVTQMMPLKSIMLVLVSNLVRT